MTKKHWKKSLESFRSHIDPEKDEQLKWIQIENENNVKRILKLIKNINHGNKDGISKRKSDLIRLVEDFHKQYDTLYSLYDNLKEKVSEKINAGNDDGTSSSSSSSATSDSELFYSPEDDTSVSNPEGTYLKDKLTSTTEVVKEAVNVRETPALDECRRLQMKLEERESELFSLSKTHQIYESEASSRIQELEKRLEERESELFSLFKTHQIHESEASSRMQELERENKVSLSKAQSRIQELERELTSFKEMEMVKEVTESLASEECRRLKKSLEERESELFSLSKTHQINESEASSRIQELERELTSFKERENEFSLSKAQSRIQELERELTSFKEIEAVEEVTESPASEECRRLKENLEERENELFSLSKTHQNYESEASSRIAELERELTSFKEKEAEFSLSKASCRIAELERELSSFKDTEAEFSLSKTDQLHESEASSRIKELERESTSFKERETEFKENESRLKSEIEEKSRKFSDYMNKIEKLEQKSDDHRKSPKDSDNLVQTKPDHKLTRNKSNGSRLNLQTAEKKMEEMAEDFRKIIEDKIRILSRRIRVAEQLHVENRELFSKAQDKCLKEHKPKNTPTNLGEIEVATATANDALAALEKTGMKFSNRSSDFMNRISKASCELKFAKDWVMRKNRGMRNLMSESDNLVGKLGEREVEIMGMKEREWRLEGKVRELEKMVEEREEWVLDLKEEKREAIRQLCVWIDHHRGKSDYYKKIVMEMKVRKGT